MKARLQTDEPETTESVCYSEEICVSAPDRGVKNMHQVNYVLLTRKRKVLVYTVYYYNIYLGLSLSYLYIIVKLCQKKKLS